MSDRSKIHHPYDQWFKALADACFELGARITRERVVHVPAQRIDVAFEPRARAPVLGVLDRLMALGPGMFEYLPIRRRARRSGTACASGSYSSTSAP